MTTTTTTVFHCSDLHFGHPAVPEQYEAIEALIQERRFDVVAISGDLTQRARSGEFQRARVFIRHAEQVSKVIVVPGNHDVAWWRAPLGVGDEEKLLQKYKTFISPDPEPVLRVPGATIVGINTAHGIARWTLTWNLRQLSVIGTVRRAQLDRLRAELAAVTSPFRTAERFGVQDLVDPRDSRPLLCDWVADAYRVLPELPGRPSFGARP